MGIVEGNTKYKLKRDLPYKSSGGSAVANLIELREPGQEHAKYYLRLKQMLMQAQMSLAKHIGTIQEAMQAVGEVVKPLQDNVEELEAQADADHEGISMAIMSSDIDISAWMTAFKNMACSHVRQSMCMVDGKVPMTSALWDNLHPDDAFDMSIRWISFFGTPSEEGQKTSSGQQSDSPTEPVEV